jgi:hypothetical protein
MTGISVPGNKVFGDTEVGDTEFGDTVCESHSAAREIAS